MGGKDSRRRKKKITQTLRPLRFAEKKEKDLTQRTQSEEHRAHREEGD